MLLRFASLRATSSSQPRLLSTLRSVFRWNSTSQIDVSFKYNLLHTDCAIRPYCTSSVRKPVKKGVLLGVGNPLLDITIQADENFLRKYDLKPNDAIVAGIKQLPIFDEMMRDFKPLYGAGGAAQNTIRVAQWLLGLEHATTFFGGVGNDERGRILAEKARESGVNVCYQVTDSFPTGVCGAVITDDNRSLVAYLGAADYFEHSFLEIADNWALVEQADAFYIGGFMFPVCNQVIFDIAEHACRKNKVMVMNLSAPFLCQYFADKRLDIMPYIDVLFGNGVEAAEFCKLRGISADTVDEMALKTSQLPKANPERERTVVFTRGQKPTVVAHQGKVTTYPIIPIKREEIRDTNGCGDAFVGGFLAELVQGADIKECIRCGQYAASVIIKHWGCTFPARPDYK